MLAGQPPFSATTAQAVLVKILTADAPSITSERRTVPPNVGAALAKSLEKLPADRFTSAAEFATALGDESFTYRVRTRQEPSAPEPLAESIPAYVARPWISDLRLVGALGLIVVLALSLAVVSFREAPLPSAVTVRSSITGFEFSGGGKRFAISRDGSLIVSRSATEGLT